MQIEVINCIFSFRGEDIFYFPLKSGGSSASNCISEVKAFLAKLLETSEDEIEIFY